MKTHKLSLVLTITSLVGISCLDAVAGQGPQPSICTRACWGARAASCSGMGALSRAIIHHTAGSGDWTTDFETGKARLRSNQNYHMDTQGWCDLGYHFMVNAGGHIYEGRVGSMGGLPRGAHDACNADSFGFTALGYFHPPYNQSYTAAMQDGLYDVIAWRMPSAWSPYGSGTYCGAGVGTLDGHRKVKATACPGDVIWPHIGDNYNGGNARDGVNARKNPPPAPSERIDVFVRTADAVPQIAQKFYIGGQPWSGWVGMGGTPAGSPDVCSWAPGRLDIFARSTDNTLIHKWYDGVAWSGWESLGGVLTADPAAVSWGNGRIDVFVRSAENPPQIVQRVYQVGQGWSGWIAMGGTPAGKPAVCSWGPGRLDIFVRGTDNTLQHKWYDGVNWSSIWESLGGVLTADPGATSWSAGRIDVFARDGSQQLVQKFYTTTTSWSSWVSHGGVLAGAPDVCSWEPGRLDVFVRGSDNGLHHKFYDGVNWSIWEPLGGVLTADPAAVSWTSGN